MQSDRLRFDSIAKNTFDKESLAQQQLLQSALNVTFSQNNKLLDKLMNHDKKNGNNNSSNSDQLKSISNSRSQLQTEKLYFEIALSTQQATKKQESDMRQRIKKFKPSNIKPPFIDQIVNHVNEENIVVGSMTPYVACLSTLFVLFVSSVDSSQDGELVCSNVSILLQSLIIVIFLIPLLYFVHNEYIWQQWIKYILKIVDNGNSGNNGDVNTNATTKWDDFETFKKKQDWFKILKENARNYLFAIFIYILTCCYACATLLDCIVGTQGTSIVTFILIILGLMYFVIGMKTKSNISDANQMANIVNTSIDMNSKNEDPNLNSTSSIDTNNGGKVHVRLNSSSLDLLSPTETKLDIMQISSTHMLDNYDNNSASDNDNDDDSDFKDDEKQDHVSNNNNKLINDGNNQNGNIIDAINDKSRSQNNATGANANENKVDHDYDSKQNVLEQIEFDDSNNTPNINDKTSVSGNESNLDSCGIVSDLPAQISNNFNATSWKLQDIQNIMAGINGIVQDKQLMERYFGGVFAKNDSSQ